MIVHSLSQIRSSSLLYELKDFVLHSKAYLKIEGLNAAGSIKLKTAIHMINGLEDCKKIQPGKNKVIESSSGNLGIALAIICKERGYFFTCVTDPNVSLVSEKYMRLYGAEVIRVTEKDIAGGYLGTRINLIREIIAQDQSYIWTNQYANMDNSNAHYCETAVEIMNDLPTVDYLVIGAGTTGTLMGCAKYFKENSPHTKIIAADSIGSVTFGHQPSSRFIPGVGTSRRPELVDESYLDDIIMIPEKDTVEMCHGILQRYGLFLGGSTGTVLCAIQSCKKVMPRNSTIVGISPDMGDKYVDTVYNPDWIEKKFLSRSIVELTK